QSGEFPARCTHSRPPRQPRVASSPASYRDASRRACPDPTTSTHTCTVAPVPYPTQRIFRAHPPARTQTFRAFLCTPASVSGPWSASPSRRPTRRHLDKLPPGSICICPQSSRGPVPDQSKKLSYQPPPTRLQWSQSSSTLIPYSSASPSEQRFRIFEKV